MSTYTPIAAQVLSGTATSVVFSSIPQYYQDLVLVCDLRIAPSVSALKIRFNNDSSGNYYYTQFSGNGSAAVTTADSNQTFALVSGSLVNTTSPSMAIVNIPDYTNASIRKQILSLGSRSDANNSAISECISLWNGTDAITRIEILPDDNFNAGCTFNLYGIGTGGGYALGGDIVTTDGTYWYHTFLSSGAFIPTQDLTNVDYLVVAGGGGGNSRANTGGGGAGGLRSTVTATGGGGSLEAKLSLTANTPYYVAIGAGGSRNFNGSNSYFGSITSLGGGYGGPGGDSVVAGVGGSGGGGGTPDTFGPTNSGGNGTANQGYAGGNSVRGASAYGGGGGGGAGAVGANGSGSSAGAGGNGVAVAISGTSTYYAGGGGGGHNETGVVSGGLGGGGTGGRNGASAGAGEPNTGGGGGGGGNANTVGNGIAAAGGSGIVIVRYAV